MYKRVSRFYSLELFYYIIIICMSNYLGNSSLCFLLLRSSGLKFVYTLFGFFNKRNEMQTVNIGLKECIYL